MIALIVLCYFSPAVWSHKDGRWGMPRGSMLVHIISLVRSEVLHGHG